MYYGGLLESHRRIAGVQTQSTVTYNATNHRWLKISESAGTITFSTSPTGRTWTPVWTTTAGGLTLSGMYVALQTGSDTGTPGSATFDNINLPPVSAGGNFFAFARPGFSTLGGTSTQATILVADYATPRLAAAAAAGKRLVFPANTTYTVSPASPVEIQAGCYVEGNNSTLVYPANISSGLTNGGLIDVLGNNVTVDNLNLDGNSQNQTNWTEYRHSLRIEGPYSNTVVKNCDLTNVIGDGVYISTVTSGPTEVFNCTISANYDNRNGISIITGRNIEVHGCTFTNLTRDDMPGHIDIEPDFAASVCEFIDLHDNTFIGGTLATSAGTRPAITVALMVGTVSQDIKVRSNDISGTRLLEGVTVIGRPDIGEPWNPTPGIVVSGNNIHNIGGTGKWGVRLRYNIGADVTGNTFNGMQWAIANEYACLGATTGNTYTGVTTNIIQTSPNCGP
jgi:hypothetical protein